MNIGDKVMRYVSTSAAGSGYDGMKISFSPEEKILVPGTVCYIHPANRFYIVEFNVGGRTFRESYKPGEEIGGSRAKKKI